MRGRPYDRGDLSRDRELDVCCGAERLHLMCVCYGDEATRWMTMSEYDYDDEPRGLTACRCRRRERAFWGRQGRKQRGEIVVDGGLFCVFWRSAGRSPVRARRVAPRRRVKSGSNETK